MNKVLAFLCDKESNPIDDLGIKTINIDKSLIDKEGYFVLDGEEYLYYGDAK